MVYPMQQSAVSQRLQYSANLSPSRGFNMTQALPQNVLGIGQNQNVSTSFSSNTGGTANANVSLLEVRDKMDSLLQQLKQMMGGGNTTAAPTSTVAQTASVKPVSTATTVNFNDNKSIETKMRKIVESKPELNPLMNKMLAAGSESSEAAQALTQIQSQLPATEAQKIGFLSSIRQLNAAYQNLPKIKSNLALGSAEDKQLQQRMDAIKKQKEELIGKYNKIKPAAAV